MFDPNTPPSASDDELTISAPLATSEATVLRRHRALGSDRAAHKPVLAPLSTATVTQSRPLSRLTATAAAVWLLGGGVLGARMLGVVDTTSTDSVTLGEVFDRGGTPTELAATDEIDSQQQIISFEVDDRANGLSRSGAEVEPVPGVGSVASATQASEAFGQAWDRWQEAEYAVTGNVVRESDGRLLTIPYRSAQRGDNALEQLGTSAAIETAEGHQTCQRNSFGVMMCTPLQPSDPGADEAAAVAELTTGANPAYMVDALPACPQDLCTESANIITPALTAAECWQLRATADTDQRWGASSVFCFDPDSNAMVARRTTSNGRTESFVATEVSGRVTDPAQLEPR